MLSRDEKRIQIAESNEKSVIMADLAEASNASRWTKRKLTAVWL